MVGSGLLGRAAELHRLETLLDDLRTGRGGALLVEGTAGIGKSALLTAAAVAATQQQLRVLAASGYPAAGEVGFGALHELLHPVLAEAPAALPPGQLAALEVALGLAEGPAPDLVVIGTAVLGLLERLAARAPVLVMVDDLHWCDPSSIEVVTFLANRCRSTGVALVASSRDDDLYADTSARFVERIALGPLDPTAATALADRALSRLAPALRDRVLDQAQGNPLALVELSAQAGRPYGEVDRTRMAVPERIETAFLAEARLLSSDARRALVLAAAGTGDARDEVLLAAEGLDIPPAAFDEAERAGLLQQAAGDDRLRFRHPLVGAALLAGARSSGVRSEHQALARVVRDPARRAWHRAAAAPGWDDDVASALDVVAAEAARRGARQEAAAAAERAAELTRDAAPRGRRLAFAADAARQLGRTDEAARLLDLARRLDVEPGTAKDLAGVEWLLGLSTAAPTRGVPGLLRLADALTGADRAEVLLWAATVCYISPQLEDVRLLVDAELRLAPGSPSREIALALLGDVARGTRVADLASAVDVTEAGGVIVLECLAFVAEDRGDLDGALFCWDGAVRALAGRPADEAIALLGRGTNRLLADDFAAALDDHQQAFRLSRELALPLVEAQSLAATACVLAARGDVGAARRSLDQVPDLPLPARTEAIVAWGEALVATAEHRHADAVDALVRSAVNPPIALWAQAALADAGTRAGRIAPETLAWTERVHRRIEGPGSSRLRMLVLRSEALLAPDESDRLFSAALEAGREAGDVLGTARTRLCFGERLRRERRVGAAREQLAAAFEVFQAEGLVPLAERAADELRATGGSTSAEPAPSATHGLTGQELQVGRLAASGYSNREIADRLYLSSATVNAHLRSTFRKLGVSRRTQLPAVLGTARSPSTDAS